MFSRCLRKISNKNISKEFKLHAFSHNVFETKDMGKEFYIWIQLWVQHILNMGTTWLHIEKKKHQLV